MVRSKSSVGDGDVGGDDEMKMERGAGAEVLEAWRHEGNG